MRKTIGWLVAVAYALAGARRRVVRRLRAGGRLPVVVHALPAEQLDAILAWLKRHGVLDSLWLTFDDAWTTLKDSMPVLEKYNVSAKVFVAPGQTLRGNVWTEEATQLGVPASTWRSWYSLSESDRNAKLSQLPVPHSPAVALAKGGSPLASRSLGEGWFPVTLLSKNEVIELSKHPLITIENHTWSHLSAPHRPMDEVIAEVVKTQETLAEWTGRKPEWLAWPFGRGTLELDAKMAELGLKTVYTRQGYEIGTCRNMALDGMTFQENLGRILGAWPKVGETL